MHVALWLQAMHLTAPRSYTKNVLTQLWVRKKAFEHIWPGSLRKRSSHAHTEPPDISRSEAKRSVQKFIRNFWFSFAFVRFLGGEGQRLLRVWNAMQHDQVQQGAVLRQDPQQGLRQVPGQEVQQIGAVHQVRIDDHCRDEITSVVH